MRFEHLTGLDGSKHGRRFDSARKGSGQIPGVLQRLYVDRSRDILQGTLAACSPAAAATRRAFYHLANNSLPAGYPTLAFV